MVKEDSEEIFYYLGIDEGAIIVSEISERPTSLDVGCYIIRARKVKTGNANHYTEYSIQNARGLPAKIKVNSNITLKPSFKSVSAWYPNVLVFYLYDKDISDYGLQLLGNGARVENPIGLQERLEFLIDSFRGVDSLILYQKDKEIESLKERVEYLEERLRSYNKGKD